MRLTKINNFKYQLDDKGVIYVEDNKLYFTVNTRDLMDALYTFLGKINKHIEGDYIFYEGEDPYLNDNFLNKNGEVIIYLHPYTYNVNSEYIDEKKIDLIFKERGNWKKSEGKYVDFLFIQGDKNSRDKNFWKVKSLINNSVDRESINMRDKTKQHESIAPGLREKFLPKSITFELTPKINPEFAKEFIEKNKVVIMKPSDGFGGRDIYVIDNYKQFIKIIKDLKIFKTKDNWSTKKNKFNNFITKINWILEEYILDPHLYKGIKYHFRVYFIISNNGKSFIYNKFRIALADEPYKKSDFTNEKIHNSHFIHIDNPHFIFLDEFISKKNYNSIVEQLIILFGNISSNVKPRCYNKSKYCFEIMAADLMLEKDMTIKFLEINTNPGYNKDQNIASDILENCMYYLIDDILPPKNKDIQHSERMFKDFIPVYKLERNPRGILLKNKELNFIDELARVWHTEGYGPKSKKDKTGGYYLSCKTGDINKNDFHIHVVGPAGKNHINSWSRKIKERRKWELLDFRLTPKEQAYHIYVKSGYRKHQNCVDYYKKYGKN